ncbi:hypothetical protein PFISCL1PPCAC_26057 [Pristionchus fissidentatus]|uniref:Membrane transporter n=1 Tax=Pristionchus fissidentatus TaxID=1538716 RepID=A0AAV5WT25_9BILA|nr:hypothetical protein PFISCL1PPCAC_26057 [Pristionchus fissidentatus]
MAVPLKGSVVFAIKHISVELIVFFVYLGYIFGNTFQSPAVYYRICRIYMGDDGYCRSMSDRDEELMVQQHNAEWSLYNSLAFMTPALVADCILGAYGDKFGWKLPIMLGILGVTIAEFGYLLTLSTSVNTPFWTTLVFGFASGVSGSISIIPVACNAFLAEITEDSDLLTVRAALFSAFQTMASVFGGFAAALLYQSISVIVAMDIELFFFVVAMVFAMWRIPQRPTPAMASFSSSGNDSIGPRQSKPSACQKFVSFFTSIWELFKAGLHTYVKRRVGHRRAFLIVTLLAYTLAYTTSIETTSEGIAGGIINAYVLRKYDHGLGWDVDNLGFWNGAGYFILAVGTICGTWILKRLGFRETTLMLIGIASSGIRVLLIGLADSTVMMYIANVVGIFAGLVQPASLSFIVQLVAPSEVGKAFSLLGVGGDFAYLTASAVYALLYRFTLNIEPGTVFFFMALLHIMVFVALVWMHIQSGREGVGRRRFSSHLQNAISRVGSPPTVSEMTQANEVPKPEKKTSIFMRKKTQRVSMAEHVDSLDMDSSLERGVWESVEDVRRSRNNQTLY